MVRAAEFATRKGKNRPSARPEVERNGERPASAGRGGRPRPADTGRSPRRSVWSELLGTWLRDQLAGCRANGNRASPRPERCVWVVVCLRQPPDRWVVVPGTRNRRVSVGVIAQPPGDPKQQPKHDSYLPETESSLTAATRCGGYSLFPSLSLSHSNGLGRRFRNQKDREN